MTNHDAKAQLNRLTVWAYQQTGRLFIIDTSIAGDNNMMKAVAEIILPGEALLRKNTTETHQQYKDRLIAMKEPIAHVMVRAFQKAGVLDNLDIGPLG